MLKNRIFATASFTIALFPLWNRLITGCLSPTTTSILYLLVGIALPKIRREAIRKLDGWDKLTIIDMSYITTNRQRHASNRGIVSSNAWPPSIITHQCRGTALRIQLRMVDTEMCKSTTLHRRAPHKIRTEEIGFLEYTAKTLCECGLKEDTIKHP